MKGNDFHYGSKMFNTLTKQLETFNTQQHINFFVCGPTVYDYSHLGHAKTYTQFDFIIEYLKQLTTVKYLINITDIDDKIINKANTLNVDYKDVAEQYSKEFFVDMAWLKNNAYDQIANASDFIPEIVSQVQRLLDMGKAYIIKNDGVYFDLNKAPSEPRFYHSENQEHSRINTSNKINEGDFVIWKYNKPNEPYWEANFGNGRPGWHIEDTAITEKVFGEQYQIHGGASDLIFPHHEAEIIQMESLSGKHPLAQMWLHTGLLEVNGTKMSKSLGNFTRIRNFHSTTQPEILRYYFIKHHYRSNIEINNTTLLQAEKELARINDFYNKTSGDEITNEQVEQLKNVFFEALNNDFNTPMALAALMTLVKQANTNNLKPNQSFIDFIKKINGFMKVFSIRTVVVPQEVEQLAQERLKARTNKEWAQSDFLREQIRQHGYQIVDIPHSYELQELRN